ncbi:MAG: DUF881 domain-containing protein [Selenomonadaceae bacterium]|nr:DUF881 domain-containing protein [Selenomonadaceae bacterium]
MRNIKQGRWSIACVCMVLGFMLAVQFRTTEDLKHSLPYQRVEELSERLLQMEKERDALKKELDSIKAKVGDKDSIDSELQLRADLTPLEGPGVIVRMDDSTQKSKAGENPNLYVIHDDDILKVINELRAAGAEAISINGQRLVGTSEIRCAGPTLSVNNVRSAAPFEIHAIGDKTTLENALKMRGGVVETLKVWGIQLEITASDAVYVPPYKGVRKYEYAEVAEEKEGMK